MVVATRTDPPFSLARLRAQAQILEVRTEQLRATSEEMTAFFGNVMDLRLAEREIQAVDTHLQGWWAGMQLAALAWQGEAHPNDLLQELQRNQRALFAYLVQEVLFRQPEQVQTFLLRMPGANRHPPIAQRSGAALIRCVSGWHVAIWSRHDAG